MSDKDAALRSLREERERLQGELAELEAELLRKSGVLQHSQRLLHYIAEYAPAVIYVKDLDGRFILSNRLHAEMLGLAPDEILGRFESDFLSEEEAAEIAAVSASALASGETAVQEFRLTLPEGIRWFHEQIFPLQGEDGRAFALAGISTDVTRRRNAEEAAAIFRTLVSRSPDGVMVMAYPIDWRCPPLHVNDRASQLFGDDEGLMSWLRETVESLGEGAGLSSALEAGEVWSQDLRYAKGDERLHLSSSAFLIRSETEGESALAWILRDVTEARRFAEERARLQDEVIAAQEEALDELSVPLLPLARGVIAVPLIGRYNHSRRQRLVEVMTQGMVAHRVRTVLLDLTAIRDVGAETAKLIERVSQMVRLLGARLLLTGVPSEVAVVLTGAEFEVKGVTIERNLGRGIAIALER